MTEFKETDLYEPIRAFLEEEGYQVQAMELIEHNIEVFKSKLMDNEHIDIKQGNAWTYQSMTIIPLMRYLFWAQCIIYTTKKIKYKY